MLRDICQNIQYGHTASANDNHIGPKFLRITDIVSEAIDWPSVPYCKIEPKKKDKYLLRKGDIVIARTGATTGYAKYIKTAPESIFASYLVRLQLIDGVNPRYVGYVVESNAYKEFIRANWGGAAQPNANAQILTSFHVPIPPLPTQRKIAAILSAYDDLIENNLRRIKILEEMAQNLYREWFVHFRFPGHEKTRFVVSPLGRIPDGWEVIKIGYILKKIKRGTKIQKRDYTIEGLIPVVDQGKDFIGGYTNDKASLISHELPLVVFGDHTRVLKFIAFPFACGADGTQLLKSNDERMPMSLFYYTLLSIDLSDFAYARHFKFLKEEPLALPTQKIADYFDQFVSPLQDQIRSLMQKNSILRRTRDLLLPKLISGEMDVSELDITIPEEISA